MLPIKINRNKNNIGSANPQKLRSCLKDLLIYNAEACCGLGILPEPAKRL